MLNAQYSCRSKNGYLFAVIYCFKGGPHRDFGFAVTYVAAKQSVHRNLLLHIGFYLLIRSGLVGSLLIRERFFELYLPV